MPDVNPGLPIYNAKSPPGPDGKPDTGTIGGVVYVGQEKMLLTCYHCVYHSALSWDTFEAVDGFVDVNTIIGEDIVPLGKIFFARRDDRVDVALIRVNAGINLTTAIPGIDEPGGKSALSNAVTQVPVRKYGAKTKLKKGIFTKLIPSVGTDYEGEEAFNHYFTNFATIVPDTLYNDEFSEKGDSGSFVLDSAKNVAGVIVLGSDTCTYLMNSNFIEKLTPATFIKP